MRRTATEASVWVLQAQNPFPYRGPFILGERRLEQIQGRYDEACQGQTDGVVGDVGCGEKGAMTALPVLDMALSLQYGRHDADGDFLPS